MLPLLRDGVIDLLALKSSLKLFWIDIYLSTDNRHYATRLIKDKAVTHHMSVVCDVHRISPDLRHWGAPSALTELRRQVRSRAARLGGSEGVLVKFSVIKHLKPKRSH